MALGPIGTITDNSVNTAIRNRWHKLKGITTVDLVELEGQWWI